MNLLCCGYVLFQLVLLSPVEVTPWSECNKIYKNWKLYIKIMHSTVQYIHYCSLTQPYKALVKLNNYSVLIHENAVRAIVSCLQ